MSPLSFFLIFFSLSHLFFLSSVLRGARGFVLGGDFPFPAFFTEVVESGGVQKIIEHPFRGYVILVRMGILPYVDSINRAFVSIYWDFTCTCIWFGGKSKKRPTVRRNYRKEIKCKVKAK